MGHALKTNHTFVTLLRTSQARPSLQPSLPAAAASPAGSSAATGGGLLMPQKIDVDVDCQASQGLGSLKVGQSVLIQETEAGWQCLSEDQTVIGLLQEGSAAVRQLRSQAGFSAVIRSVKRTAGDPTAISSIQVRITSAAEDRPQPLVQAQPPADDPAGFTLTTTELERLAYDEQFRATLTDARLQQMLLKIDGAANREQALKQALEMPDFREFADQMLHIMKPSDFPSLEGARR